MRRTVLPLVALWFCALVLAAMPVHADDAAKPAGEIDAGDKAALEAAIGKDVVIRGTIKKAEWSATGKVMNVEFDKSELIAAVFDTFDGLVVLG